MLRKCVLLLAVSPALGFPQQSTNAPASSASVSSETVIVTGSFEPVPLAESNRSVVGFDLEAQPLLYKSFADYLSQDPSIDLRQGGVDGIQTDFSIRGSSFGQSLVLLNGLRINDAQTGHHNLDLAFPIEGASRIEVLHGSGSTLYGEDAVGGAVNFVTAAPTRTEIKARIGFGNFDFNQQRLTMSYLGDKWSEAFAGSNDASSGFEPDRDYRSSALSSETRFRTSLGQTTVFLAGSDRPFGADQFYGPFNSWERTKGWLASIHQTLGESTSAAFGYRRHSDEFVLERDHPAFYENNHVSQSWQADIRRISRLSSPLAFTYGADADGYVIDSNNLGHHSRNRGAAFANVDLQSFQRLFLSLGAREEVFDRGLAEFAPTVAGAVWVRNGLRIRASASRGFRLPTYTDLYYSDPANIGNPLLKPETAWSFEAGPEWHPGGGISAELTVFRRLDHNDIDYVKYAPTQPWQATNIENLTFTGVETIFRIALPRSQNVELGYTGIHGAQKPLPGVTSKYVFDYPTHHASFSWFVQFKDEISVRNQLSFVQRFGHDVYPVWDVSISRSRGHVRPFLQLSNLSNTGYEEIPGVRMPGRGIMGGVELWITPDREPGHSREDQN
jgi:outer membrane receptor protein involved in Fe transport